MVLDEKNNKFYLNNKIIKLTFLEKQILSTLIINKDSYTPIRLFNNNIGAIRSSIYRLNEKIQPSLKIICKSNFGYKLIVYDYKKQWKEIFLTRINYYELINTYKKITETEEKLIELKNKLKTIEKNIF